MMDGHTALLLMRAKRKREEEEISQACRQQLAGALSRAYVAEEGLRQAERLLEAEFRPHLFEQIGRKLSDGLYREVMKAVHHSGMNELVIFTLPTRLLTTADPQSTVARVVNEWKLRTTPRIKVSAMQAPSSAQHLTLDVQIPELRYREIQCWGPS